MSDVRKPPLQPGFFVVLIGFALVVVFYGSVAPWLVAMFAGVMAVGVWMIWRTLTAGPAWTPVPGAPAGSEAAARMMMISLVQLGRVRGTLNDEMVPQIRTIFQETVGREIPESFVRAIAKNLAKGKVDPFAQLATDARATTKQERLAIVSACHRLSSYRAEHTGELSQVTERIATVLGVSSADARALSPEQPSD